MSDTQDLARQVPHIVQQLKFSTNTIESAMEVLGQQASPAAQAQATRVWESVKLIRSTVRDLLDAYMGTFSSSALLTDTSLVSIVDQAVLRVLNSFKGRGQRLIVQVPENIHVEASSSLLIEGISELLSNASRCAPVRSTVEVRGASADGGMSLAVANEGPPIPRDVADDLLMPADVPEPGRTRPRFVPGSSGLRTVKRIAEHHLGTLEHGKDDQSRTVVTLRLPLGDATSVGERLSA